MLAVLDREHLDGQNPRLKLAPHEHFKLTDDQDFIAIDKSALRELVALVVAEDLRSAQRALEKVRVEYEPLPPCSMPWKLSLRERRFSTRSAARTCFLKTAWRGATSTKAFARRTAFSKRLHVALYVSPSDGTCRRLPGAMYQRRA